MNQHVYPVNDLREHNTKGSICDCNPRVEMHGDWLVIIHNSWDGREITERAVDAAFAGRN